MPVAVHSSEGLGGTLGGQREEQQLRTLDCRDAAPEGNAFGVVAEHKQVALLDALGAKGAKASREKLATEALATVFRCDDKMVNEAAPAVVATQDCSYNLRFKGGSEACAWIALKEGVDGLRLVRATEAHAGGSLPKGAGSRVVVFFKRSNRDAHDVVRAA